MRKLDSERRRLVAEYMKTARGDLDAVKVGDGDVAAPFNAFATPSARELGKSGREELATRFVVYETGERRFAGQFARIL